MQGLVVLTGPVSVGKSSTAVSLAAKLLTRGVATAVVGFDELLITYKIEL